MTRAVVVRGEWWECLLLRRDCEWRLLWRDSSERGMTTTAAVLVWGEGR
jgi:hypothetical protein